MPNKVQMTKLSTVRSAPSFSFASKPPEKKTLEQAPGPGKYGIPSNAETTKRSLTVRIDGGGTSLRNKEWKAEGGIPGPGQYTAIDPNQAAQTCIFGSETRLPKKKIELGPDPGQYSLKSTLESRQLSMSGRFEVGVPKSETKPAPGQYGIPCEDGIRPAAPGIASLRFTENRSKTDFTKSTVISPGPTRYSAMKELGGNIATRTSPSFTFTSRRKPLRPDNGRHKGPDVGHYTTFGP